MGEVVPSYVPSSCAYLSTACDFSVLSQEDAYQEEGAGIVAHTFSLVAQTGRRLSGFPASQGTLWAPLSEGGGVVEEDTGLRCHCVRAECRGGLSPTHPPRSSLRAGRQAGRP